MAELDDLFKLLVEEQWADRELRELEAKHKFASTVLSDEERQVVYRYLVGLITEDELTIVLEGA